MEHGNQLTTKKSTLIRMLNNWSGSSMRVFDKRCSIYVCRARFRNARMILQRPHSLLHPTRPERATAQTSLARALKQSFQQSIQQQHFRPSYSIISTSSVQAHSLCRTSISPPSLAFGRQVFPLHISSCTPHVQCGNVDPQDSAEVPCIDSRRHLKEYPERRWRNSGR